MERMRQKRAGKQKCGAHSSRRLLFLILIINGARICTSDNSNEIESTNSSTVLSQNQYYLNSLVQSSEKKLQDFNFEFHKYSAQNLLNFLTTILPQMTKLKMNVTNLLESTANTNVGTDDTTQNKNWTLSFRNGQEQLEQELNYLEKQFSQDQLVRRLFKRVLSNMESELEGFHQNMKKVMLDGQRTSHPKEILVKQKPQKISTEKSQEFIRRQEIVVPCGGLVDISSVSTLTFTQDTAQLDGPKTCIWILYNGNSTKISLTPMQLNFDDESEKLALHYDSYTESILNEDVRREIIVETNLASLTFSINGSSGLREFIGFHLDLKKAGDSRKFLTAVDVPTVIFLAANDTNAHSINHPPSGETYGDNERTYFLLHPGGGKKVALAVHYVDTEAKYDYLDIFKFSVAHNKFQYLERLSGLKQRGPWAFEGDVDQPLLLLFYSDTRNGHSGFRASVKNA